jgi:hypothetical protein
MEEMHAVYRLIQLHILQPMRIHAPTVHMLMSTDSNAGNS